MSIHTYVAAPSLIYALVDDRAEFDKINRPATDAGENAETGGHVVFKSVVQEGCHVVFQHWIKQPKREAAPRAE